ARLLLARDVRPTGDERPECGYLVTRRHRADLLDAGLVMAAADRLPRGRAAHRRVRIRLPARLVARRPIRGVRTLCRRRDRAPAQLGPPTHPWHGGDVAHDRHARSAAPRDPL